MCRTLDTIEMNGKAIPERAVQKPGGILHGRSVLHGLGRSRDQAESSAKQRSQAADSRHFLVQEAVEEKPPTFSTNMAENVANFDLGNVVQFEYHPEGSDPVILGEVDFGAGMNYEDFDDFGDFEGDVAASSVPSGGLQKSGKDKKNWLVEIQKPEVDIRSREHLRDYIQGSKNENTVKKTQQIVTAFQNWLSEYCEEERPIHTIGAEELDNFIANYFLNKKTVTGQEHQPDTLTGIHRGLMRHLREMEYEYDLLSDEKFSISREVLHSKRSNLKKAGLGNKHNRSEGFDDEQIEKMWESGALGASTPEDLQNTLYYFLNVGFGLRGSHEARQMKWGDVELKQDDGGILFLEFNERASKTRNGAEGGHVRSFPPKVYQVSDSSRCPVAFYKEFEKRRPGSAMDNQNPFYLTNKQGAKMQDPIGYTKNPMGVNKLRGIVKNMAQRAGLTGRHTNHSLRKTTCQTLMAADVPPILVAQLTGHKNISSLNNYSNATMAQQKAMSTILTGEKNTMSKPAAVGAPQKETALAVVPSPGSTPAAAANHVGAVSASSMVQGMFSGAAITGSISVNINYNVSSNKQSNVNLSPLISKPAIDSE